MGKSRRHSPTLTDGSAGKDDRDAKKAKKESEPVQAEESDTAPRPRRHRSSMGANNGVDNECDNNSDDPKFCRMV